MKLCSAHSFNGGGQIFRNVSTEDKKKVEGDDHTLRRWWEAISRHAQRVRSRNNVCVCVLPIVIIGNERDIKRIINSSTYLDDEEDDGRGIRRIR